MRDRNSSNSRRRGSTLVETAILLPTVFLFVIGMCVIGLGIYRYQQVASLAARGHAMPRFTAPNMQPTRETRRPLRLTSTTMPSSRWRSVSTQLI